MSVPDYQSLLRPLLESISDGEAHAMRAVSQRVAEQLNLSEGDLQETLPSGRQTTFANRLGWAKTYLAKAGAVATEQRGVIRLTGRGRELLARVAGRITQRDLMIYPEFAEFTGQRDSAAPHPADATQTDAAASPEEQLAALYAELNAALASELLAQVQGLTPAQFERLVVEVLVAMGYGGSVRDAGQALGRSGDNGIDGVVKQDPLGLDRIYLQAKRWKDTVHSPEIRTFSGSLTFHKAAKGVFITTSSFSQGARNTAQQIGNIILIDGQALALLMIEFGVGVITRDTYRIRRVDSEFFEEL